MFPAMKISVLISFLVLGLAFPGMIVAKNSVTIINNGSTNSKTDVSIETDGDKQEFHTEGDEDVDWTSADGKSSVKIDSNSSNSTSNTNNSSANIHTNVNVTSNTGNNTRNKPTVPPKPTTPTEPTAPPKPTVSEEIEKRKESLIALLKEELNRIKSIFESILH